MTTNNINFRDIENIIPTNTYNKSDQVMRDKYTEWCLKKYMINGKTYITISIKHPNSEKYLYINTSGEQIIYSLGDEYDKYIVSTKYWYGE